MVYFNVVYIVWYTYRHHITYRIESFMVITAICQRLSYIQPSLRFLCSLTGLLYLLILIVVYGVVVLVERGVRIMMTSLKYGIYNMYI